MAANVEVSFSGEPGPQQGYEIRIAPGLRKRIAEELAEVVRVHRFLVIADSRVGDLYGAEVVEALTGSGRAADLLTFPEGEANKNRESWAGLSDQMLEMGIGRDAAVVALGGGVTGDLAGFVAATYLRGLPLVQMPTSLLAMIDSSVGGKTGVDTEAGKNLIGAFLQPVRVLADVETLRTLEPAHVRSGLAEAIKHGAILDAEHFSWIADNTGALLALEDDAIEQLLERSVSIKAEVVGRDEREGGLRKALNFGHTIGHAVEAASNFELLHGEAISIGMVAEAIVGENLGISRSGTADALREVLDRVGLPTEVPGAMDGEQLLQLTRVDKKAREGRAEYALIDRIGQVHAAAGRYSVPVDDRVVRAALGGG